MPIVSAICFVIAALIIGLLIGRRLRAAKTTDIAKAEG